MEQQHVVVRRRRKKIPPDAPTSTGRHPPTRLGGNLAAKRALDPYHEILTTSGQLPRAVGYERALAAAAAGRVRLPAAYGSGAWATVAELVESPYRAAVIDLLGVLVSYGSVTNNQAAAFTGEVALADPRSKLVASLYGNDLIRITPPFLDHGLGEAGRAAVLYQLGSLSSVRKLCWMLTYTECVGITGGRPLRRRNSHPRHDVLAAELALRAPELPGVATVLGPGFGEFVDLAPVGDPSLEVPDGGPDLVIVRADGLRIAVEVTATTGAGFNHKAKRWAELLAQLPMASSGLAVVFLAAPSLEDRRRRGSHWPSRQIRNAIEAAVKLHPGASRSRTADRMFHAEWADWFPTPLIAAPSFHTLEASHLVTSWDPTGAKSHGWRPTSLLRDHGLRFEPNEKFDAGGATEAAGLLGQTPHQLRSRQRPERLAAHLLQQEAGPPLALPPQRERSSGRLVGRGQGAAGDATHPRRLLGTASNLPGYAAQPIPHSEAPARPQHVAGGDMTDVRNAAEQAARLRAEHLIAVHEGLLKLTDVMEAATVPGNRALRKLELKQLCLSSGMSDARWRQVRDLTLAVLGEKVAEPKMTIGWLHDPRAGGRRHYAFADALRDRDQPPWRGFPWHATTT